MADVSCKCMWGDGHTSHGVDCHAAGVLEAPLKPVSRLSEGLQEEVMQHWREVGGHLSNKPVA